MITQKLKKLVVKEALSLREFATKEEKRKLVARLIDGSDGGTCIYGIMTGWCSSDRALFLLNKSAVPYTDNHMAYKAPSATAFNTLDNGSRFCYSPIEYYICQGGAKIEDLINLIKS